MSPNITYNICQNNTTADSIYRITAVVKFKTFKTDIIVFIGNVIMCLTSHWPIIFSIRVWQQADTESIRLWDYRKKLHELPIKMYTSYNIVWTFWYACTIFGCVLYAYLEPILLIFTILLVVTICTGNLSIFV